VIGFGLMAAVLFFLPVPLLTLAGVVWPFAGFNPALQGALWVGMYLLTVAAVIPVVVATVRWLHGRSPWELVAPGRSFDAILLARSAFLYGGIIVGPMALHAILEEGAPIDPDWRQLPILLPVLLVPLLLQVTAEELVFRGYVTQGLGRVVRRPGIIFVLVALLFAGVHGYLWAEGAWDVRIAVLLLSLMLSWITWRADRLEPAIGVHLAHNLLFFMLFDMTSIPAKPSLLAFDPVANLGHATARDVIFAVAASAGTWAVFWYLGIRRNWLGLDPAGTPRSALESQPASV